VAGASASSNNPTGEILVWDVAQLNPTTGIAPTTFRQSTPAPVFDIAFAAPESTLLYTATTESVQVLDFSSGEALFSSSYTSEPPYPQLTYAGQAATPGMLYADGDALWLVQAGQDGLEALQLLTFDDRVLVDMAVTGAGDDALLALAFQDADEMGQVFFYNLPTGEAPLHQLDLAAEGLMFGPDGSVLAVLRADGGLEWWSLGQE
jgi:hypothetical protein